MKSRLTNLLACPDCQARFRLEINAQRGDEVVSGFLRCAGCALTFPVRHGIPRFVSDEAYAASFAFEWKRWRRTQFDTGSRRTSESAFTASTGKRPCELSGKLVLDAGCGAGRYMDLVAREGAEVLGVDLSLAVEVARENLGTLPNCHFIQTDLLRLPFLPETFDFIYSIGVLHHTPNTRESFSRLVPTLKPSGEVAIWVYPRRRLTETFRYFPNQASEVLARDVNYRVPPKCEALVRRLAGVLDWTSEASSRIQRAITIRLPPRWLYWLCHAAIPLYFLYRIPLFYPLRLLTKIAMHPDPEWRVLDTFDWYSPRYQWKHGYGEVCGWFKEAGLVEVAILPRPVAVRGKKGEVRSVKDEGQKIR